jgi:hypothetical protein
MAEGQSSFTRESRYRHTANDNVCSETKEHEYQVGDGTPSSLDDLEETDMLAHSSVYKKQYLRMTVWGIHLELRSNHSEQQDCP